MVYQDNKVDFDMSINLAMIDMVSTKFDEILWL